MKDLKNKNIFAVKGRSSAETLFANALQDAEEAFNNMSLEDAWTKFHQSRCSHWTAEHTVFD